MTITLTTKKKVLALEVMLLLAVGVKPQLLLMVRWKRLLAVVGVRLPMVLKLPRLLQMVRLAGVLTCRGRRSSGDRWNDGSWSEPHRESPCCLDCCYWVTGRRHHASSGGSLPGKEGYGWWSSFSFPALQSIPMGLRKVEMCR